MEQTLNIKLLRLRPELDADIPIPEYMTQHAAGMDLCAAIKNDLILKQKEISLIPTGFAICLPNGFEAQIRPRSGLAIKHGIGIINSPGTIDADYRGEIMIALINLGNQDYTVHRGDRIAQMIVNAICRVKVNITNTLDQTDRNAGGFGHTGI